jgi:hypothetical protein
MVILRRVAVFVGLLGGCAFEPPPDPDEATPPSVAFEFDKSGADEQIGTVMIPVVLSKPSDTVVTVGYAVLSGGDAVPTMDFEINGSQVTFQPGVTRELIPVGILSDFDDTEADETFTIALADPIGAELDALKAIHEIKIADHILPRIKWVTASVDTQNVETTSTTLTIELTSGSEGESTIVLGVGGDADSEDFTLANDTVITIPNGATSVDVPLNIIDDNRHELPNQELTIELKGASQNMVLAAADTIATHTIIDNEAPPTVQFSAGAAAVGENGTGNVMVTLNRESELPVTVTLARDDATDTADNNDASVGSLGVLTFAPHTLGVTGETTKPVSITITNDTTDENSETVILTLSAPTNATLGTAIHTLTINADNGDPPPSVQFSKSGDSHPEGNSGQGNETVNLTLSAVSGKDVTIPFTVGGSAEEAGTAPGDDDFDVLTASPVVIPAGQLSATVTVRCKGDTANENNETVVLTIGNPTNASKGAQTTYTVTIVDDD